MKSTAEKQRLRRKADAKVRKFSKVLATKGMVSKHQTEVGTQYIHKKEAARAREKAKHEKTLIRDYKKKGLDFKKIQQQYVKEAQKNLSAIQARQDIDRYVPGVLTDRMKKKGFVKVTCHCGNWVIGTNVKEISFCANCGSLNEYMKKTHMALKQGHKYILIRLKKKDLK